MTAVAGLCTVIGVIFKMLMTSQDRRVTEIAAAHKAAAEAQSKAHALAICELSSAVTRLSADIHSMWGAFDRMNRLQAIRLSASSNIPPEMKFDAAEVLKTIDEKRKLEP